MMSTSSRNEGEEDDQEGKRELPLPTPVSFVLHTWDMQIDCPSVEMVVMNDVVYQVTDQDEHDNINSNSDPNEGIEQMDGEIFCSLAIDDINTTIRGGSQHLDIKVSFNTLSLTSRFQHIARPLTFETLTGYPDQMTETESWERDIAKHRALSNRFTELISIQKSTIHIRRHPRVMPTGDECLFYTAIANQGIIPAGKALSPLRSLACGCTTTVMASLGDAFIDFDDVCVNEFSHFILTLYDIESVFHDSLVDQSSSSSLSSDLSAKKAPSITAVEHDDYLFEGILLIQVTSPHLSIQLDYNQKPFELLTAPEFFFECGFPRHIDGDGVRPGSFECGLQSRGIIWTDLTIPHSSTHTVCLC